MINTVKSRFSVLNRVFDRLGDEKRERSDFDCENPGVEASNHVDRLGDKLVGVEPIRYNILDENSVSSAIHSPTHNGRLS